MINFVVSVFPLCCVVFCFLFCFWFYCALNTQQGGYVCFTSLYSSYYYYMNNLFAYVRCNTGVYLLHAPWIRAFLHAVEKKILFCTMLFLCLFSTFPTMLSDKNHLHLPFNSIYICMLHASAHPQGTQ